MCVYPTYLFKNPFSLQTLNCVQRIAEVLLQLQKVGKIRYIGWKMEFCCQKLLIEELQRQAKEMEKELDRWNKEVALARKQFYELNHYTTHQLLVLRRELGKLKSSEAAAHSLNWGQVMALLGSISTVIPCAALANVVQQIVKESVNKAFFYAPCETVSLYQVDQSLSDVQSTVTKVKRLPNLSGEILSEKDLSAEQRAYYTRIVEKFDYSKTTALQAIAEVNGGDWNDIVIWLKRNGQIWEKAVQEAEDTEDDEGVEEVESEIVDAEEKSEEKNTLSPKPSIYVCQMGIIHYIYSHYIYFYPPSRNGFFLFIWYRWCLIFSNPVQSGSS